MDVVLGESSYVTSPRRALQSPFLLQIPSRTLRLWSILLSAVQPQSVLSRRCCSTKMGSCAVWGTGWPTRFCTLLQSTLRLFLVRCLGKRWKLSAKLFSPSPRLHALSVPSRHCFLRNGCSITDGARDLTRLAKAMVVRSWVTWQSVARSLVARARETLRLLDVTSRMTCLHREWPMGPSLSFLWSVAAQLLSFLQFKVNIQEPFQHHACYDDLRPVRHHT
mmetsp:Transcript_65671/g.173973  ORF Transcript_65671/g.173973 Transcript_65671/m.173973 type:complete len:221 (-) Transcript_65671:81-743(-)